MKLSSKTLKRYDALNVTPITTPRNRTQRRFYAKCFSLLVAKEIREEIRNEAH